MQSIFKQVTPFLVQYQTDKPMLPFMGEDVYQLLKGLMDRFIKEKTMKEAALSKLKSLKKISERLVLEIRNGL